jgi:hypothetical protein
MDELTNKNAQNTHLSRFYGIARDPFFPILSLPHPFFTHPFAHFQPAHFPPFIFRRHFMFGDRSNCAIQTKTPSFLPRPFPPHPFLFNFSFKFNHPPSIFHPFPLLPFHFLQFSPISLLFWMLFFRP